MSAVVYPMRTPTEVVTGLRHARSAVARGQLVCVPTDTGYALVADAFNPRAVDRLRRARQMPERAPVGVLVSGPEALHAVAADVTPEVQALSLAHWPGPLTLVVPSGDSLSWDLGDTEGTVAVRMPGHPVALELVTETGPLAQSAARFGRQKAVVAPAALARRFADEAALVLGPGDQKPGVVDSTVVDATALEHPGGKLAIVRQGALNAAALFTTLARKKFTSSSG